MRALCLLLILMPVILLAQSTVAIGDFRNQTSEFYLDNWENLIPGLLKNELSVSGKLVLVERERLESVLREQALSMTGLVDSSTAQQVGGLLGAQYIISGTIDNSDDEVMINCRILRVSSGELKTEYVRATDTDHLNEMIELLGNNILFTLAADREYQERVELKKYPTGYFLAASAVLGTGSLLAGAAYNSKLDDYHSNTKLTEFDNTYDQANQLYKTRNVLAALTAAALAGTLYCWWQNLNPGYIQARNNSRSGVQIVPVLYYSHNGNWSANVIIHF